MIHERSTYKSNGLHMCTSLECDRDGKSDYWPCEWVELVARLTGIPVGDIDAVDISGDGPVVFSIRMRPKAEMVEVNIISPDTPDGAT